MPRDPNEVGSAWKKSNDKGDYLSISLDVDALLVLTGGETGKVDLKVYPITFEKTNALAPDYRVKFYPRAGVATKKPSRPKPLVDDDDPIPF